MKLSPLLFTLLSTCSVSLTHRHHYQSEVSKKTSVIELLEHAIAPVVKSFSEHNDFSKNLDQDLLPYSVVEVEDEILNDPIFRRKQSDDIHIDLQNWCQSIIALSFPHPCESYTHKVILQALTPSHSFPLHSKPTISLLLSIMLETILVPLRDKARDSDPQTLPTACHVLFAIREYDSPFGIIDSDSTDQVLSRCEAFLSSPYSPPPQSTDPSSPLSLPYPTHSNSTQKLLLVSSFLALYTSTVHFMNYATSTISSDTPRLLALAEVVAESLQSLPLNFPPRAKKDVDGTEHPSVVPHVVVDLDVMGIETHGIINEGDEVIVGLTTFDEAWLEQKDIWDEMMAMDEGVLSEGMNKAYSAIVKLQDALFASFSRERLLPFESNHMVLYYEAKGITDHLLWQWKERVKREEEDERRESEKEDADVKEEVIAVTRRLLRTGSRRKNGDKKKEGKNGSSELVFLTDEESLEEIREAVSNDELNVSISSVESIWIPGKWIKETPANATEKRVTRSGSKKEEEMPGEKTETEGMLENETTAMIEEEDLVDAATFRGEKDVRGFRPLEKNVKGKSPSEMIGIIPNPLPLSSPKREAQVVTPRVPIIAITKPYHPAESPVSLSFPHIADIASKPSVSSQDISSVIKGLRIAIDHIENEFESLKSVIESVQKKEQPSQVNKHMNDSRPNYLEVFSFYSFCNSVLFSIINKGADISLEQLDILRQIFHAVRESEKALWNIIRISSAGVIEAPNSLTPMDVAHVSENENVVRSGEQDVTEKFAEPMVINRRAHNDNILPTGKVLDNSVLVRSQYESSETSMDQREKNMERREEEIKMNSSFALGGMSSHDVSLEKESDEGNGPSSLVNLEPRKNYNVVVTELMKNLDEDPTFVPRDGKYALLENLLLLRQDMRGGYQGVGEIQEGTEGDGEEEEEGEEKEGLSEELEEDREGEGVLEQDEAEEEEWEDFNVSQKKLKIE